MDAPKRVMPRLSPIVGFRFTIIELMIGVAFIACYCTVWTFLLMVLVVHVYPWVWTWLQIDQWETRPPSRTERFGQSVSKWVFFNWVCLVPLLALLAILAPIALLLGVLSIVGATILGGVLLFLFTVQRLRDVKARRIERLNADRTQESEPGG